MGKDLNGKELGRGITQRKDGRYMGRIHIRGSKKEVTLYDRNLKMLKNKVNTYRALAGTSQWDISMTVTEWFEQYSECAICTKGKWLCTGNNQTNIYNIKGNVFNGISS